MKIKYTSYDNKNYLEDCIKKTKPSIHRQINL